MQTAAPQIQESFSLTRRAPARGLFNATRQCPARGLESAVVAITRSSDVYATVRRSHLRRQRRLLNGLYRLSLTEFPLSLSVRSAGEP